MFATFPIPISWIEVLGTTAFGDENACHEIFNPNRDQRSGPDKITPVTP